MDLLQFLKDLKSNILDPLIKYLSNDSTAVSTILVIIAFLLFIIAAIASVVILYIFQSDYFDSLLIKNPLNVQTTKYNITDSCSLSNARYKYIMFLFIGCTIFVLLVASTIVAYQQMQTQPGIKDVYTVCLGITIVYSILLGIYLWVYFTTDHAMSFVQNQIRDYNKIVAQNMSSAVMSQLKMVPANSIDEMYIIQRALYTFVPSKDKKQQVSELISLFFTLNLYKHYLKMGTVNINLITDCLNNVFDKTQLLLFRASLSADLSISTWSPTDYLDSKYTFIEDYSELYIKMILEGKNDCKITKSQNILKVASNKCGSLTELISYKANTFRFDNTFTSFMNLASVTIATFVLPLLFIGYMVYQQVMSGQKIIPPPPSSSPIGGSQTDIKIEPPKPPQPVVIQPPKQAVVITPPVPKKNFVSWLMEKGKKLVKNDAPVPVEPKPDSNPSPMGGFASVLMDTVINLENNKNKNKKE